MKLFGTSLVYDAFVDYYGRGTGLQFANLRNTMLIYHLTQKIDQLGTRSFNASVEVTPIL